MSSLRDQLGLPLYTPHAWHWQIEGDDRFWSSASSSYVATLPDGAHFTRIASEEELCAVLEPYGLNGPLSTAADVKAEAGRRIEAIMPDYVQRNTMALALETMQQYGPDPANWPPELQAINAAAQAKWAAIKAIRVRSNEIEAMSPIPVGFRDDGYWD